MISDMSALNRRHFLSLLGATAASSAFAEAQAAPGPAKGQPEDFSFIFLTDAHIQPELDGVHGVKLAVERARTIKADFAIQNGDHVFDALGVTKSRATQLFDQYAKTEQDLGLKVHHTLGNHDVFGIYPASGVGPADADYGKKMFEARFGPTYYSFDHKGYHFIVLDSIGITPEHQYEASIDDAQLGWLEKDLATLSPRQPVIVAIHIPLVTAVSSYAADRPEDAATGAVQERSGDDQAARRVRRAGGVAGAHACERAGGLARDSVYHLGRDLRQLVAWHAAGDAGGV